MHAELLARRVPGAAVGIVLRRPHAVRRRASAPMLGVPVAGSVEEVLAVRRRRGGHLLQRRHARRPHGGGGRGGQGGVLREARVARSGGARTRAGRHRGRAACRSRSASTAASIPRTRRWPRRSPPGAIGEPHLVRISSRDPEPPPLEYVRTSGGLFLDMTIHDFDMARFVTGSEVVEVFARGGVRVAPAFAQAGDIDTALVTLVHASGCLTAIDNCRATAYGFDQRVEAFGSDGMAASENPPAHTGVLTTAEGAHRPPLPHFFLERYLPSYEREWQAFVGALRDRDPAAGRRRMTPARRWSSGWRRGSRCARGAPSAWIAAEVAADRAAMRIFVTGAGGFVGSNLVHVFAQRHGAEVIAPSHEHRRPHRPPAVAPLRRRDAARRDRARRDLERSNHVVLGPATRVEGVCGRHPQRGGRRQRRRRPRRAHLHRLGVRRHPGPRQRDRAAQPDQPLRLPQGRLRAGRHPARGARDGGAHRRRAGRPPGAAADAAPAGRGVRVPGGVAGRCPARGRRFTVWDGDGLNRWPRRRWPPTPPSSSGLRSSAM